MVIWVFASKSCNRCAKVRQHGEDAAMILLRLRKAELSENRAHMCLDGREICIHRSTGSTCDCFDNAVAESFFATLEKDLLRRRPFATRQDACTAVFNYIETFYNPTGAVHGYHPAQPVVRV
jgi:hypothetical protein